MCDCGFKDLPGYCDSCTDNGKITKVCETCEYSSEKYPGTCFCGRQIELMKLIKIQIVTACGVGDIEELNSLIYFPFCNNLETVKYINSAEFNNERPLTIACLDGQYDVVDFLLKKGVDVNVEDDYLHNTGLHKACQNCDLKMVNLLLDHGARKDKYNVFGNTPEDLASYCEDPLKKEARAAIIELLKD
jgi:hypothetical protein